MKFAKIMGPFLPLLNLEVEHTFFSRDLGPGFEFGPTPQTQAVVAKTGLLVRNTLNGIRVFYDHNNTAGLKLFAADPDEPLHLVYKVYAKDRWFSSYTELPTVDDNSILYFDSRDAKIGAAGRLKLHTADHVSENDSVKLDTLPLDTIFSHRDRIVNPDLIISIGIGKKEIRILDAASNTAFLKYFLKFQARETFWKYYLLGSMANKKSYIADLNHEAEFEETGRAILPDNRMALTFRSKQRIPLRERSEYRFQLKEKDPNGGKVLIKRLPVAAAGQYYKEIVDGKEAIVSEIFINC